MALKDASLSFPQQAEDIDALIQQRINGKLRVRLPCDAICYCGITCPQHSIWSSQS